MNDLICTIVLRFTVCSWAFFVLALMGLAITVFWDDSHGHMFNFFSYMAAISLAICIPSMVIMAVVTFWE